MDTTKRTWPMQKTRMPWPDDDRCILCFQRPPFGSPGNETYSLSEEHVIPESLGGTLSVDFLCAPCNNRLGHSVEAHSKEDPRFGPAVDWIAEQAPDFAAFFVNGLSFVAEGEAGSVRIDVKDGRAQVKARRNPDGSIIQQTEAARDSIARELSKRGESVAAVEVVLAAFDAAPEGDIVPVSSLHSVIKRPISRIGHDFSGDFAPRPLFLKIAYEALACHVGRDIYEIDGLDAVRRAIDTPEEDRTPTAYADPSGAYGIEQFGIRPDRPEAVHRIAVGAKGDHALVSICLFGSCRFDVHFLSVVPRRPFLPMVQSLVDGSIDCGEIEPLPPVKDSIF